MEENITKWRMGLRSDRVCNSVAASILGRNIALMSASVISASVTGVPA